MKVLIINPQNYPATSREILAEPLDALQLATQISTSYDVSLLDLDYQQTNTIQLEENQPVVAVFVYDYQLPLHTDQAVQNIYETIKCLPKGSIKILISKTCKYCYEEYLLNGLDILIAKNAEPTLERVLEHIKYNKPLTQLHNIITKDIPLSEDASCVPYNIGKPNRSLLKGTYMTTKTIISSRGCINRCAFCPTPYYFGEWSTRNLSSIYEEIEELVAQGTKQILFLDDNFTADNRRVHTICHYIKSNHLEEKAAFGCLASVNTLSEDLLSEMYQAGFRWIHLGIESGHLVTLRRMNKPINLTKAENLVGFAKSLGFRVRTSFIMDYQGTQKEHLYTTFDLIRCLQPHELRLHKLAYRYHTPLYDSAQLTTASQYIHTNTLEKQVLDFVAELKTAGYTFVDLENKGTLRDISKDTKLVAFGPIPYGLGWRD